MSVIVKVKELHSLKYQILGFTQYKTDENGEPDYNTVLGKAKGLLSQGELDESTKRVLRKILKTLDSEIEDINTRVKDIRTEKEGCEEDIKKAFDELDNVEITLDVELGIFGRIENFKFTEIDKETPCNYELVYEKFFV